MAETRAFAPIILERAAELDEILTSNSNFITVVCFIAPWSEHCNNTKELTRELLADPENKQVSFVELAAEDFPTVCSKYDVMAVPTILFFKDKEVIDRLTGQDARHYANRVSHHAAAGPSVSGEPVRTINRKPSQAASTASSDQERLEERLRSLINRGEVMVFMKGNPSGPRCGFSRQVIELLNETGVTYDTFDILEDEEVRQGLKTFSNWQTYPQIYVRGELVGGLDIIRDLKELGNLADVLKGNEPV